MAAAASPMDNIGAQMILRALGGGGGTAPFTGSLLGTPENPATPMSTGAMARETGSLLGNALSTTPGWGTAAGSVLGAVIPGAGIFGRAFDMAHNQSSAFSRSPMGHTRYDPEGNIVGAIKDFSDFGTPTSDLGGGIGTSGGSAPASGDKGPTSGGGPKGEGGGQWGGSLGSGLYAAGGKVQPPAPGTANPPGPDDQIIGAKTGELVIPAPVAKQIPSLLAALQAALGLQQ